MVKYAKIDAAIRWSGGTTILRKGQTADDDHPLVRERPDLWRDESPGASLKTPRTGPPAVERATRAPGEVRKALSRPAKKVAKPAEAKESKPTAAATDDE
jgi:hypothetical protein